MPKLVFYGFPLILTVTMLIHALIFNTEVKPVDNIQSINANQVIESHQETVFSTVSDRSYRKITRQNTTR